MRTLSQGELADAAASLWEAVLEAARVEYAPGGAGDSGPVSQALAAHGYAAIRQAFADMAATCHIGWNLATREGFDSPFDWEFCPRFAARAVDMGDASTLPALRSDWRDVARAIGREDAGSLSA